MLTGRDHVKTFRLFELAQAENTGKLFQLEDWESAHLQQCSECQGVVEVFKKQFASSDVVKAIRASPQYNVGEQVQVVGPSDHRGKSGVVVRVVPPKAGDFVYRYRVRFSDGTSDTFFRFELETTT